MVQADDTVACDLELVEVCDVAFKRMRAFDPQNGANRCYP
jgi:hypothetical protein